MSVNKVFLLGRLGKHPELKSTKGGTSVCEIALATNEKFKEETRTEWHSVILFGKSAETMGLYGKKGSMIYVEGRIQTRSWEDKSGATRYKTEIVADEFKFCGDKE